MDAIEQALAARLKPEATDSVLAALQARSEPVGESPSIFQRFAKGINDVNTAGAQMLVHSLPQGLVGGVNRATQYVNDLPGIGPVTKALGMTPASPQELDANIAQQEQQYQAARGKDAGIDWARLGGNVVATAPIAAALPAQSGALGGAALGGVYGGVSQPVTQGDYATGKLKQMGIGGATGGVVSGATSAIARALNPQIAPQVRQLADEGVGMTPGQMLGGGIQRTEDAMTSTPILGDMIKNSQRRAINDFNTAAYARALAPIGVKPPTIVGNEGVQKVADTLGEHYDALMPRLSLQPDAQLQAQIAALRGMAADGLPDAQAAQFNKILDTQVVGKATPDGLMNGETLKGVLSTLRDKAKGYSGDSAFDNRQLGDALNEAHAALTQNVARQNPEAAQTLNAIDTGWANYARIRQAAASMGAKDGVFTPAQLANAVRGLDKSVGHGDYAKGNALMQDLSGAGKNVLGSTVPDSGTPFRSFINMAGPAALMGIAGKSMAPEMGAAALPYMAAGAGVYGGAMLPYTQIGGKALAAALLKRPDFAAPLANKLGALSPYLGAASVPIAEQAR